MKSTLFLFLISMLCITAYGHNHFESDSLNNKESNSTEHHPGPVFNKNSNVICSFINKPDNEFQRRKMRYLGVGICAFGPSLAYGSLYVDYLVTPSFSLEVGTDVRSVYGGLNLFPFAGKNDPAVTPYIGAFINYTTDYLLYEFADAPKQGFKGYFPIGVQVFLKSGLIISPEIAVSIPEYYELSNIYWGMKVGYKFKILK